MLHLPALKLTGEIEKVFRAAKDMRLAVRGLYGEGTEATGDFYQISNQTTLGKTEDEIISDFKHLVIPKIIDYEHHARKTLVNDRTVALDDKVCRALGILRTARLMASEETLFLLSHLRMGVQPRPDQGHRPADDQRAVPADAAGAPRQAHRAQAGRRPPPGRPPNSSASGSTRIDPCGTGFQPVSWFAPHSCARRRPCLPRVMRVPRGPTRVSSPPASRARTVRTARRAG